MDKSITAGEYIKSAMYAFVDLFPTRTIGIVAMLVFVVVFVVWCDSPWRHRDGLLKGINEALYKFVGLIIVSLGGAAIFLMPLLILSFQNNILIYISSPLAVFPALILGLSFFWLRCRSPLTYGIIEVTVSIEAVSFAIQAPADNLLAKLLGLLGGIYVLVRGLDNVDKGLKRRQLWEKIFWRHRLKLAAPL
jgi:hypothetical protein